MTQWTMYFLLVAGILLIIGLPSAWSLRGGGGRAGGSSGGSRGGSSRGSSTGSRGGSRVSSRGSSRSSGSKSSYRSSYRSSGSKLSSSYIKYQPTKRYTRVYFGYYGYYYDYYELYFYYSGSARYRNRGQPKGDVNVCANYEANDNGTTMGVFTCPNSWEPADFSRCCGEEYAQYCCKKPKYTTGQIVGIVFGVLIAIVVVAIVICSLVKNCDCDCDSCEISTSVTYTTSTTTGLSVTVPNRSRNAPGYHNMDSYDNNTDEFAPPFTTIASSNPYEASGSGYDADPPPYPAAFPPANGELGYPSVGSNGQQPFPIGSSTDI